MPCSPIARLRQLLLLCILVLGGLPIITYSKEPVSMIIGNARFTVIDPHCIRLEYSESGKFIDEPSLFAINRSAHFADYKVTKTENSTTLDTGAIRLTYTPDGKPFNASNLSATIKNSTEWHPGMENKGNLGGTTRTLDGWNGPRKLDDGVVSKDGWYLLDDSRNHLYADDWVKSRAQDSGLDWYLFGYGHDYKAALKSLTTIGGAVPMPRKYALGAWYSRYWPYTSKEYREIVKEYADHDFPLDVIVLDMNWHITDYPGYTKREYANMIWTGYTYDKKLLPDAEELFNWFHQQGLAVTLNDHPAEGVQWFEDCYPAFMKAMGKDPSTREEIPFDAADKKYMDTFWKYTHQDKLDNGVDFWWLDWQQYPNTRSIPDLENLKWLNNYFYRHTAAGGKRGLSFSRWAGWGDHRHPIHFSGDTYTNWEMLEFEVPFTSTAGNVGCFFWSHDIGGHMGERNEESYARWCQFGVLTAALRSHSTIDPNQDRRPWKYPKWAEDSIKISFHLRSRLFPYIYTSVWQACKDSIPLNRPMYIEYPENEKAYKNPQQFYFGDNILAAPITKPGTGEMRIADQKVWFPEGVWYNFFTGQRHTGQSEAQVSANINEFPLYIRGGVPFPMQPYTPRMATTPLSTLIIRCYPGEDGKPGTFKLYEDDGITQEYKDGKAASTVMTYTLERSKAVITVEPTKGTFNGQLKERSYIIELPNTEKATAATIDGKPVQSKYDEQSHTNTVTVPARSIKDRITVVVDAKPGNFLPPLDFPM